MKLIHFAVLTACTTLLMLLVFFLFRVGLPLYSLMVVAVPVGVFFVNHPKMLYAGILCTVFSSITFPGLPSTIFVYHLLCALAAGTYVLNMALRHGARTRYSWPQFFGLLFAVNILVIIVIRGIGLRVLGSSEWGGMRYFEMLIPLTLIFLRPDFVYTRKDWKWIGVLFLCFSV